MIAGNTGAWLALPRMRIRDRLVPTGIAVIGLPFYGAALASFLLLESDAPVAFPVVVAVPVVTATVIAAAEYALLRWAVRGTEVDASGTRMRRGTRVVDAERITSIVVARFGRGESILALTLRGPGIPHLLLPIASDGRSLLDAEAEDALARFLGATRAVLPRDRYDPHGRLSRIANPGWLTPEDAVTLVRDPAEIETFRPRQPPVRRRDAERERPRP